MGAEGLVRIMVGSFTIFMCQQQTAAPREIPQTLDNRILPSHPMCM